jgi:hypothetical protein
MRQYFRPEGWAGVGSDIQFCSRAGGGKRCDLCRHHATFDVWSKTWHFYYLTSYCYDEYYTYWRSMVGNKWFKAHSLESHPVKYNIRGLAPHSLRSLQHRGCKGNRKCKCVSIVQRAYWYCPECWPVLHTLAKTRGEHEHDTMLIPRKELKHDLLILKLSGVV